MTTTSHMYDLSALGIEDQARFFANAEPTLEVSDQRLAVYLEDALVAELTDLATARLSESQRSRIASEVRKQVRLEISMVFTGNIGAEQTEGAVELLRVHSDKVISALARIRRMQQVKKFEEEADVARVKRSIQEGSFEGVGDVGVDKFLQLYLEVLSEGRANDELRKSWFLGTDFCFENVSFEAVDRGGGGKLLVKGRARCDARPERRNWGLPAGCDHPSLGPPWRW